MVTKCQYLFVKMTINPDGMIKDHFICMKSRELCKYDPLENIVLCEHGSMENHCCHESRGRAEFTDKTKVIWHKCNKTGKNCTFIGRRRECTSYKEGVATSPWD